MASKDETTRKLKKKKQKLTEFLWNKKIIKEKIGKLQNSLYNTPSVTQRNFELQSKSNFEKYIGKVQTNFDVFNQSSQFAPKNILNSSESLESLDSVYSKNIQ